MEKVIARNVSRWGWEYDENEKLAQVFVDDSTGGLRLDITETHTKTGLGAGVRTRTLVDEKIGTLQKPNLRAVASATKKHGHARTRAGHGFTRKWTAVPSGKEAALGEIIQDYAASHGAAGPSTQDKRKELINKLVQMSDKDIEALYARMGKTASQRVADRYLQRF